MGIRFVIQLNKIGELLTLFSSPNLCKKENTQKETNLITLSTMSEGLSQITIEKTVLIFLM
jgi:hypothetical protein